MTTTPPTPESVLRAALHDSGDGCWYDADCGTGPEVCKGPDDSWHENQPARILAASPTLASAIALGLAWQRASAALPEGWELRLSRNRFHSDPMFVTASGVGPPRGRGRAALFEYGSSTVGDETSALIALAEALEARRGE